MKKNNNKIKDWFKSINMLINIKLEMDRNNKDNKAKVEFKGNKDSREKSKVKDKSKRI
jgi:hypothetical protein